MNEAMAEPFLQKIACYFYCGHPQSIAFHQPMLPAKILEWPHPHIDEDLDAGLHQWREVTPLAYRELRTSGPLREEQPTAWMHSEPVDILPDGDGLFVCCKRENGSCFARLLPGGDWWKRDYLPVPEVSTLF